MFSHSTNKSRNQRLEYILQFRGKTYEKYVQWLSNRARIRLHNNSWNWFRHEIYKEQM